MDFLVDCRRGEFFACLGEVAGKLGERSFAAQKVVVLVSNQSNNGMDVSVILFACSSCASKNAFCC